MGDIYENIEEYNLNKKRKMLIVFDEMIADMFDEMIADMLNYAISFCSAKKI